IQPDLPWLGRESCPRRPQYRWPSPPPDPDALLSGLYVPAKVATHASSRPVPPRTCGLQGCPYALLNPLIDKQATKHEPLIERRCELLSRFSAPVGGQDHRGFRTILLDLLRLVKRNLYNASGRPCHAIPKSSAIPAR